MRITSTSSNLLFTIYSFLLKNRLRDYPIAILNFTSCSGFSLGHIHHFANSQRYYKIGNAIANPGILLKQDSWD
jgi:hypothetical protein